MRKILILFLCLFGITLGFSKVKTVKVNVPSSITIQKGDTYSIDVIDTTMSKYVSMYYRDSILHITGPIDIYEPIKIRITTPDSVSIITGRNYKILR